MTSAESNILCTIDERLQRIETMLIGNGDPSKGIIVRLDRVERQQSREKRIRSWLFGVAGTVVGGVVLALVSQYLF